MYTRVYGREEYGMSFFITIPMHYSFIHSLPNTSYVLLVFTTIKINK